ncbi:hypothetical protein Goshw_014032 [Gossypium schwendimanii]|uniref:Uncharacterized protein n=1 Tax=Gossypium schwendimanii TaxID=34291 RepID=A0A7J9MZV5_GOSSC|nr:hypothetical protein [Gossypium schwendimanii]
MGDSKIVIKNARRIPQINQSSEPLLEIFRTRKPIFKNSFFSILIDRRTWMLID